MPNGPPTTPFVESLMVPIETCVIELNELIMERISEGYDLVQIIPCPGKNWFGARHYHWLIVWKPSTP